MEPKIYYILAIIIAFLVFLFGVYKLYLKLGSKKPVQTKVVYDTLPNGKIKFIISLVSREIGALKDVKLFEDRTGLKYDCDYRLINDSTALIPGENKIEVIPQSDKYEISNCKFMIKTSSGDSLNYVKSFDSGSIKIMHVSASSKIKSYTGSVRLDVIDVNDTIKVSEAINIEVTPPNSDN